MPFQYEVDFLPVGYQSLDGEGRIIHVNRLWLETLGYNIDAVRGRSFGDFLVDGDRALFASRFPKFKEIGMIRDVRFRMKHGDGSIVNISFDGRIERDKDGRFLRTHCLMRDITEQTRLQAELKSSEEKYRLVVENSGQSIVIVQDGRIRYANSTIRDDTGYSPEDIVGRHFTSFLPEDRREESQRSYELFITGNLLQDRPPFEVIAKDGQRLMFTNKGVAIDWYGRPAVICFMTNVTEKIEMHKAHKESEEKYRTIFENAPLGIFRSTPDGRFIEVNPVLAEMLGYDSPESVLESVKDIGKQIYVRTEKRASIVEKNIENGSITQVENWYRKKDGSLFLGNLTLKTIKDNDGEILYLEGLVEDITERKMAENIIKRSEENMRGLMNASTDMIALLDVEGKIISANRAAMVKGLEEGDYISRNDNRWIRFLDVIENAEEITFEDTEGDTNLWHSLYPIVIEGKVEKIAWITRDITERFNTLRLVEKSLKEKDILLQEVHHRVKNNLQIISSLINLQASHIDDPRFKGFFVQSSNRIRAIALVHDKLYHSEDISCIYMDTYIKDLLRSMSNIGGLDISNIDLRIDAESVPVDIETAIPCGLILNELFSNSVKYAFEGRERGTIQIDFWEDEGLLHLSFEDDGRGFEGEPLEKDSLGLRIVKMVSEQLDARVNVSGKHGVRWDFVFSRGG